jgi:hypothetical protein
MVKDLRPPRNEKHLTSDTATNAQRLLERHIFPELGAHPIAAIGPRELLMVLKQIELKGLLHTARRAKQRCSRVFRHAIGLGYISRDITRSPTVWRIIARHRRIQRPAQSRHRTKACDALLCPAWRAQESALETLRLSERAMAYPC